MKRLWFWLMMIGLVVIVGACSDKEDTEEEEMERIVAVTTAEVVEEDFVLERRIYGRTAPNQITPVTIPLPGEVKELAVTAGDILEEGDKIATLSTMQGNIDIESPADGEITGLGANEEDMVSNEEPFALIVDTETMILDFSVTATIQQILTLDKTYQAEIDGEKFTATVTKIDMMPGENGLYPIQATVKNPKNKILSGMIAEIIVPEQVLEKALTIPTSAVIHDDDETFVFVIENNIAEKRSISVLETGTDNTAIEGDIKPGDQVVTSGHITLSDGDQVEVQEEE